MKEIHAMTGKEISNYRENMRRIEAMMDHPVPPGLLSMEDLSRRLSSKEIAVIREDIRRIEKMQFDKKDKYKIRIDCGESTPEDAHMEITVLGIYFTIGSLVTGDYIMLPLGLLLLIPVFYRVYKAVKKK